MADRKYRLAAVTSHPVQYQGPLFRRLAADEVVDLTVFYGHDASVAGYLDHEFGVQVKWDSPLLDGYRSVFLTRRSDGLSAGGRLAAESRIIGYLWRHRFDAVFIHSYATPLSLFAYAGALTSRTPVLLRTDSERVRPRPWWVEALKHLLLRPLFAVTAGALVIGKANRDFFEHYGVRPSRQFFTPFAVDNEYFLEQASRVRSSRQELRRRHGWPDEVVVVGYSGKLIPLKCVDDLIDAVARLQGEGLRVGLMIIGDGPERDALQERARTRRLKWTVFTGFKNQSELASCYTCLDVFVLPSRAEKWGLVLNEAMVFGLPVVASSMVGACADLVEDGTNGYVFEVRNVDALSEALRPLVASSALRRQFGERSEEIVRRYSFDACVRGILDGLHSVTRRMSTHPVGAPYGDSRRPGSFGPDAEP